MNVLTVSYNRLALLSINSNTICHIRMPKYDSNRTSLTNWFHFAGTHCHDVEYEPLNAVERVEEILAATFKEETLGVYFWEQFIIPTRCIWYWTNQPEKTEVWTLTILWLDRTGQDIWDHICGFPVIMENPAAVKFIFVRRHTRQ